MLLWATLAYIGAAVGFYVYILTTAQVMPDDLAEADYRAEREKHARRLKKDSTQAHLPRPTTI